MGTFVKPHNIKFLKIRTAFLTLLAVNNHNNAIRRILRHFVAKAPNHTTFIYPILTNSDSTYIMFVNRTVQ